MQIVIHLVRYYKLLTYVWSERPVHADKNVSKEHLLPDTGNSSIYWVYMHAILKRILSNNN